MESGWDPEIRKFFLKIINTVTYVLLWVGFAAIGGIFFGLAKPDEWPLFVVIVFYLIAATTFFFLVRFLYRTWK